MLKGGRNFSKTRHSLFLRGAKWDRKRANHVWVSVLAKTL